MKKQLVALVSRSLCTLLLTGGLAAAEDTPQLQKLKYTVLSPTSEQVVLQLNGSYSPKVFTLKDENPRVIFDFADMTYGKEVKGVTATNGSIVKRVRVGRHTDDAPKTRIVFDVATLKGVTYTQKFDEKSSSLIIQFTGPEKAAAPPRKQEAQPEKVVQPDAAAAAEAPQPPSEVAPTGKKGPEEQPAQPKEAAQAKTAQPATPQSEPAVEAVTAAKPDQPKSEEKAAPAPPKETAKVAAEKKGTEKTPPAPPVQPQPDAGAEAKPAEKAEAPLAAGEAKPEKTAKETAAPAAITGEKKEEKTVETAAKEPTRPEAAAQPQPSVKADAAPTGDKGKTEAAKTVAPAKTMEGPQLEYVKFDASSPKGEMVLFKLNGFHPPTVHGVEEGIPRVVCEFNNTKLIDSTKGLIKADGKFVKVIRTSKTKKPEKVRVVIDLEPNRSYDLQQVFFKDDNLFVIIVNTVKK